MRQIRRLLSKDAAPPVREVVSANVLGRIAVLLTSEGNPKLQFECAWALTNVASTEFTQTVADLGVIPTLAALLASGDSDVREQSMWCLGNIAGDCATLRDVVLAAPGAVDNLLLNIQHPASLTLLRNATWVLSNYCRGKPAPLRAVRECAAARRARHTPAHSRRPPRACAQGSSTGAQVPAHQ